MLATILYIWKLTCSTLLKIKILSYYNKNNYQKVFKMCNKLAKVSCLYFHD